MTKPPQLKDFMPADFKISNPDRKLHHIFNEADCYALWAAYSAGRPLLVRGKPGTGKSQMARAIAEQLGWAFVSEVVRGNTELSDLHWHFDAIGRLAEAQIKGTPDSVSNLGQQDRLDPLNFLAPGAFWWAFNWKTAQQQYQRYGKGCVSEPEKPHPGNQQGQAWTADSGGVVLLLDEIDKAEPDLPNGLLETLGDYQFSLPYSEQAQQLSDSSNRVHRIKANSSRILVIITTNEERELPRAFVRRCFVHTLKMEESEQPVDVDAETVLEKRQHWLMERGRLHFADKIAEAVYQQAATLLWDDRIASPHSHYAPGLAEYIDLLTALHRLSHQQQQDRLAAIAQYALNKELED